MGATAFTSHPSVKGAAFLKQPLSDDVFQTVGCFFGLPRFAGTGAVSSATVRLEFDKLDLFPFGQCIHHIGRKYHLFQFGAHLGLI